MIAITVCIIKAVLNSTQSIINGKYIIKLSNRAAAIAPIHKNIVYITATSKRKSITIRFPCFNFLFTLGDAA